MLHSQARGLRGIKPIEGRVWWRGFSLEEDIKRSDFVSLFETCDAGIQSLDTLSPRHPVSIL